MEQLRKIYERYMQSEDGNTIDIRSNQAVKKIDSVQLTVVI